MLFAPPNVRPGLSHGTRNPLAVNRQDGFLAHAAVAVLQVSNTSSSRRVCHVGELYWLILRSEGIERCFNKLKHFRRVAARFDRRATYFLAFILFAGAIIWS